MNPRIVPTLIYTAALAACTTAVPHHNGGGQIRTAQLPQAQERLLGSRHTGKTYRIQTIAVGEQPPGGYPVLYLLDGDAFFPIAASMAQGLEMRAEENRAAPLLIVGIGYPGGKLLDLAARAEDYTPPSEHYTDTGDRLSKRFGGAEAFRRFLDSELKPEIASRFTTHPQHQSLFGHSYGGLYGLYSLFEHTADFQNYLIASPSVWWNNKRILSSLPAFLNSRRQPGSPVSVRLSVGEYEQKPAPHLPASHERQTILNRRGMVSHTRNIGQRLAALPDSAAVRVHTEVYPAATHAGSAYHALSDGLKFVYSRCLEDASCAPATLKSHPVRNPDK